MVWGQKSKAIKNLSKINDKIASHLGVSIERAAQGIHQVVNTQMAEGVRLISTQRGLDPSEASEESGGGRRGADCWGALRG